MMRPASSDFASQPARALDRETRVQASPFGHDAGAMVRSFAILLVLLYAAWRGLLWVETTDFARRIFASPRTMNTATETSIQRLPEHVANQIAAGEVVQRPGSVVKELMENALGRWCARRIVVDLKDAGRNRIVVADDGKGMGPGDAEACFGRHATSKLRGTDDLLVAGHHGVPRRGAWRASPP